MRKIHELIFRYNYSKWLKGKKDKQSKRFVNYGELKSVLVLYEYEYEAKYAMIQQIVKALKADGITTDMCCYMPKEQFMLFNGENKQISGRQKRWGRVADSVTNIIHKSRYDLVIDLSLQAHLPLQYLLATTDAQCKAGMKHDDFSYLDFIVEIPVKEKKTTTVNTHEVNKESMERESLAQMKQVYDTIIYYVKQIQSSK